MQLSSTYADSRAPSWIVTPVRRLVQLGRYRSLIRNIVERDLKLRYRNSIIGFLWSLLNPLLMMMVFTVVFAVLLHAAPTKGPYHKVPYALFLLAGILPWNFLAASVTGGIGSVVNNASLVNKVYFPREVLPVSVVMANGVNYLLALIVFLLLTFIVHIGPSPIWLYFPIVLLGQILFTIGIALFLSALNVFFRDTEVIMEVLITLWFFLTPVFYDISQVFPDWNGWDLPRMVRIVNPMASYLESYRGIFLLHAPPDPLFLLREFTTGALVAILGYVFFVRLSRRFGDTL